MIGLIEVIGALVLVCLVVYGVYMGWKTLSSMSADAKSYRQLNTKE